MEKYKLVVNWGKKELMLAPFRDFAQVRLLILTRGKLLLKYEQILVSNESLEGDLATSEHLAKLGACPNDALCSLCDTCTSTHSWVVQLTVIKWLWYWLVKVLALHPRHVKLESLTSHSWRSLLLEIQEVRVTNSCPWISNHNYTMNWLDKNMRFSTLWRQI